MFGRRLAVIENLLAAIPFAIVALVAFVNVLSRYFLNASLAFTSELTVNFAVWMLMMGAVIELREGAHLGFSALHESARGAVRAVMTVLITVAILAFLAVLLYFGLEMAVQQAGAAGAGNPVHRRAAMAVHDRAAGRCAARRVPRDPGWLCRIPDVHCGVRCE